MDERDVPYHKLLQQVLWPALAGNVLWSFFAVLIPVAEAWLFKGVPPSSVVDWVCRLVALVMAGSYLCADWLLTEKVKELLKQPPFKTRYAVLETILAVEITLVAVILATVEPIVPALCALSLVYLTAAFGLWKRAWVEAGYNRSFLIYLNLIAFGANAGVIAMTLAGVAPGWSRASVISTGILVVVVIVWWFHIFRGTPPVALPADGRRG